MNDIFRVIELILEIISRAIFNIKTKNDVIRSGTQEKEINDRIKSKKIQKLLFKIKLFIEQMT